MALAIASSSSRPKEVSLQPADNDEREKKKKEFEKYCVKTYLHNHSLLEMICTTMTFVFLRRHGLPEPFLAVPRFLAFRRRSNGALPEIHLLLVELGGGGGCGLTFFASYPSRVVSSCSQGKCH
jgi:hypothetical protein